jgi:hypothetical protein
MLSAESRAPQVALFKPRTSLGSSIVIAKLVQVCAVVLGSTPVALIPSKQKSLSTGVGALGLENAEQAENGAEKVSE